MYNPPCGQDMEFILQAMKDNPVSRFTMKPEIAIPNPTPGAPRYAEHVGWRATWEEVGSGAMVEWEVYTIGRTPEETLQQFVKDLRQAFDSADFRVVSNKLAKRSTPHFGA